MSLVTEGSTNILIKRMVSRSDLKRQVVLTVSESKRLIAMGVAAMPEVRLLTSLVKESWKLLQEVNTVMVMTKKDGISADPFIFRLIILLKSYP